MKSVPAPANDNSLNPALVGRDVELAKLHQCFANSVDGHGGLVVVAGEAGIGKTELVNTLATHTESRGALVLQGGCYDLTTTPPYGPWREAINRYRPAGNLPELPEIFRSGTDMGDVTSGTQLFEVARDFLFSITTARPLVILLEDIQWSDPASLSLLRFLSRQVSDHRVLIAATYRDDEINIQHQLFEFLPILVRESNAIRIELRPINEADIRSLITYRYHLAEDDANRLSSYLNQHADGNPLYVRQILDNLEAEQQLRWNGGRWILTDLGRVRVPPLLMQMIASRVRHVSAEYYALLEVAAVIGQEVDLELWQEVSGANDDALIELVSQSTNMRILSEGQFGLSIRFSHALMREAIYQRIVLPGRRRLHLDVAEALLRRDSPDVDVVAYHLY